MYRKRSSWFRSYTPQDVLVMLTCTMAIILMTLMGVYVIERIKAATALKSCINGVVYVQMDEVGREWQATQSVCYIATEIKL